MDFKTFTAGQDDNDRRLDKVIRKFLPKIPLTSIYKYLRKGLIKLNQKKSSPEQHVFCNDEISIATFILDSSLSSESKIQKPELPVVFRNEHILILDKPYDIPVHGSKDSLEKLVTAEFQFSSTSSSLSFTPGPLHRLDRKTTGLIAFSQSLNGAKWFSENIKNHTISKKYIAVLQGKLEKKEIWTDYILKESDSDNTKFHTVKINSKKTENSKEAVTIVTPVLYGKYQNTDFTLSELEIKTGRTHQIRAQSSLHNHPLLGDTAYGGNLLTKKYPDFFLQAFFLSFPQNNPLNLPPQIQIEYSDALKSFLKDCYVL